MVWAHWPRGHEAAGVRGAGGRASSTGPGNPSPAGTVLDDVSKNHTCVPITQCPCMLSGVVYAPGEVVTAACQTW